MKKPAIFLALLPCITVFIYSSINAQTVCKVGSKYGYNGVNGKILIKPVYDQAFDFNEEGIAMVKRGDKLGFVNKKGKEIVSPKYSLAGSFSEGFAAVSIDNLWGYIDTLGREVIPLQYSSVGDFKDGFAIVVSSGKKMFINKNGESVVSKRVNNVNAFSEGLAIVRSSSGKFGFIDTTGKVVISARYYSVYDFSDGIAPVETRGGWIFIDKKGKEVSKTKFDDVDKSFSCGRLWIKEKNRYGYIDKDFKIIIPAIYEKAMPFAENVAAVCLNGKWGIINLSGEQIVKPEFDEIKDFSGGYAAVSKNGKWGYINIKGQIVIPVKYDSVVENSLGGTVESVYEGLRKLSFNGEWGFADFEGGWFKSVEDYEKAFMEKSFASMKNDFKIGAAYNKANGTYTFFSPTYGTFVVKVPNAISKAFKSKYSISMEKSQKVMEGGYPKILKLAVKYGKKIYFSR